MLALTKAASDSLFWFRRKVLGLARLTVKLLLAGLSSIGVKVRTTLLGAGSAKISWPPTPRYQRRSLALRGETTEALRKAFLGLHPEMRLPLKLSLHGSSIFDSSHGKGGCLIPGHEDHIVLEQNRATFHHEEQGPEDGGILPTGAFKPLNATDVVVSMGAAAPITRFFVASAALAGIVALRMAGPFFVPEAPHEADAPIVSPGERPDIATFNEVTARPFVSPSRRLTEPHPEANVGGVIKIETFDLVGVIISPAKRVALLRPKVSNEVLRVVEGQTVGGWEVRTIEPTQITLGGGNGSKNRMVLTLSAHH